MKRLLLLLLVGGWGASSCQKQVAGPTDDYWQIEDPARHGFDVATLDQARAAAADLPNFYALLVVRHGRLVVEQYHRGKTADDLFHLRSVTKNFTSALTGIALEEGRLAGIDVPVKPYFADLLQGQKETITLRHLLNMSSGLTWNEDVEVLHAIEHKIPDPVYNLLGRDLAAAPGQVFNYNSLSPHVVADILVRESGRTLRQLAQEKLFSPLGIGRLDWTKDPTGAEWGGFGLQLRARDLAKFGQLYLNRGNWQGQQLVPENWIMESARPQLATGISNAGYSFQWWHSGSLSPSVYYGMGYGGQALMIVPGKDLLVVACQEYFVDGDVHRQQWNGFVQQVFLPIFEAAN